MHDGDACLSIHDQLFCYELNNHDQLQLIKKIALLHMNIMATALSFRLLKLMYYSYEPLETICLVLCSTLHYKWFTFS